MALLRMPWRLFTVLVLVGVGAGAVFGFVRGLDYLPTLPFAIVEGSILFGVPAAVLGLVVTGAWWLESALRRLIS